MDICSMTIKCNKCGHVGTPQLIEQDPHIKAVCNECGSFIKFISKPDKYGTKEQREAIWDKTSGKCAYCGVSINPFKKNGYHYDHINPQSAGGGNETENLYITCAHCNTQKGKKTLSEYRQYLKEKFKLSSFVFFFEILKFSIFGKNFNKSNDDNLLR